jgi:replicative DNA helicase
LQFLFGSGFSRNAENRQTEVSEISRMLKVLARELDVPILCLSQLSRKVEERPGHRPMMSDLRESGSLEQDADIILFLLRRDYYDPYDRPGQAELIVAKNRHGETGSITMTYRKEIAQFANFSQQNFQPSPGDGPPNGARMQSSEMDYAFEP